MFEERLRRSMRSSVQGTFKEVQFVEVFKLFRSRYTSWVGTRPSFIIGWAFLRRHFSRSWQATCFYNWTADRLSAEGGSGRFSGCIHRGGQVEGMLDNVQDPKIYYFPDPKLLHRAMLRSEWRCGSRKCKSSNRAKARSEGSSAVTSTTQWSDGKLLVKV